MHRRLVALVVIGSLLGSAMVSASTSVRPVVQFDAAQAQFPEGIAADARGNLYVSLAPRGEILKIDAYGTMTLFASLVDPATVPMALGALGLVTDRSGDVYVALASFDPATHGVWRLSRDGQDRLRLPGTEAILVPNALVFDRNHNLYVTDSFGGSIWRVSRGGAAEIWLQDSLLAGIPGLIPGGAPIGANGITYWHGTLFVANTTTRQVLRVPVRNDGSAGTLSIEHTFAGANAFLDGLTVDVHGTLYVLVAGENTLVGLEASGETTIVDQGLDVPASLTFGMSRGTRHSLFITNFAVFPSSDPDRPGPGVVELLLGRQ